PRPTAHGPRPAPTRRPGSRSVRRRVLGRRVRAFRLLIALLALVVVARLVDVQLVHSSQYRQEASRELTQPVTLPAQRGGIFDRAGRVLAMSVPTDMVLADDFQVRHSLDEARALGPLIGLPAAKLAPLLQQRSGYVPLVHHLSTTKASKVSAMAFPGITLVPTSRRVVPDGTLASPVVGTVDAAGQGAGGLESELDQQLAGKAGSETLLASPVGVPLPGSSVARKTPSVAGSGVELTLDQPLQYTTEQALGAEMAASHAVSGTAVVMDVHTGQILSMANLVATKPAPAPAGTPLANVTAPVTIGPTGPVSEAPSNLALTQDYEPGSVFKLVPFSAALADGVITPSTTYAVPWTRQLDGYTFHDATPHPVQQLTATTILAQSSNIGTSFIATALGENRLLAQVHQLGFGNPTGLDFPGESSGLLVGPTQWAPTDYVSLAIGQVDAVNAVQVLDAYNAIADGGTFVAPKLVRAAVGPDGAVHRTQASATHRVVPAHVASELSTMLEKVVSAGTGVAGAVPGYLVAGKTGTSQVPSSTGGYVTGAFDATFVGFAPANHPVLSAIVVLDRPQPIYGGAVAAPVFSQVMRYALHRYDIPTSPGLAGKPQATASGTLTQLVKEAA
ncbi:MAG: peptidoglycan D,D-transpeptidase FtsI family protein, partial [Acidimicrobiales bacterium]